MAMADQVIACRSPMKEERLVQLSSSSGLEEEVGSSDGDVVSEHVTEDLNEGYDDTSDSYKYYTDGSESSLDLTVIPNALHESSLVLQDLSQADSASPNQSHPSLTEPQKSIQPDLLDLVFSNSTLHDLCNGVLIDYEETQKLNVIENDIPVVNVLSSVEPELSQCQSPVCNADEEPCPQSVDNNSSSIPVVVEQIDIFQCKSPSLIDRELVPEPLICIQLPEEEVLEEFVVEEQEKQTNLTVLLENLNLNETCDIDESKTTSYLDIPDIIIVPASPRNDSDISVEESEELKPSVTPKRNRVRIRLPISPEPKTQEASDDHGKPDVDVMVLDFCDEQVLNHSHPDSENIPEIDKETSVPSSTSQAAVTTEIGDLISSSPVFKVPQIFSKPTKVVKTMSSEVEVSLLEDEQPPASLLPCSLPYLGQGSHSRDASLDVNEISDKEEDEQKDFFDDELPSIKKGHMLDEEISKNRSEAGPSTAFDELKGAGVSIREDELNYLCAKATGLRSNDCRKSVLIKFDPLSNVTDSPGMAFTNNNPQPDKPDMFVNSESENPDLDGTLIPISPPTSLPANINVENPRPPGRSRKENNDGQGCHRCKDLERMYKKKIDDIEKQSQGNVKDLEKRSKQLEERNNEMHVIIVEYEKTISHYVSNTETQMEALRKEKDDALFHLANIEVAFNDVHSKYEKSKAAIEQYKANQEKLQASINESAETITALTSKYEKLKEHAHEKLDEANRELASMKKAHHSELTAQKILYQKLDMDCRSLRAKIEQEKRDKAELDKICDALVEKLEINHH